MYLLLFVSLVSGQLFSTCPYASVDQYRIAVGQYAQIPFQRAAISSSFTLTGIKNTATNQTDLFSVYLLTDTELANAIADNFQTCPPNLTYCVQNVTCAKEDNKAVNGMNLTTFAVFCHASVLATGCGIDAAFSYQFQQFECAPGCTTDMIGSGRCDGACYNSACQFDHNDCNQICAICPPSGYGNGICDPNCNVSWCGNDGGDCAPCAANCMLSQRGDGTCQEACNVKACQFDSGDCVHVEPAGSHADNLKLFY